MSKTLPVLMKDEDEFGPANPDGWKLEDLCLQLISEKNDENQKCQNNGHPALRVVVANNGDIIEKLAEIMSIERGSREHMIGRVVPVSKPRYPRTSRDVIYPDSVDEEINF